MMIIIIIGDWWNWQMLQVFDRRWVVQIAWSSASGGGGVLSHCGSWHPCPPPPGGEVPRSHSDPQLRRCRRRPAPTRRPCLSLPRRQRYSARDRGMDRKEQRGRGQSQNQLVVFVARREMDEATKAGRQRCYLQRHLQGVLPNCAHRQNVNIVVMWPLSPTIFFPNCFRFLVLCTMYSSGLAVLCHT